MTKVTGKMNIDFEESYDQESDIYYVSFKTGEPSYAVEIDDVLIVEEGMFTGLPTGFRVLNFKKNPVGSISFLIKKVRKNLAEVGRDFKNRLKDREIQLEQRLEQVLS